MAGTKKNGWLLTDKNYYIEKAEKYCQDCFDKRTEYDARLALIKPSVGDMIKLEEAGQTKSYLEAWESFKQQQRKIWEDYAQKRLSCENRTCKNGRRNEKRTKL